MSWRQLGRKIIYTTPYINIYEDTVQLESGTIIDDYSIVEFNDGIVIVATDVNGRLIAIDEYKYAVDKTLRILPGGGIEAGQTPEAAAIKELREETGYEGEDIEIVGQYYEYASKLPHVTYIARIHNARKVQDSEHEATESIDPPVLLDFSMDIIDQFSTSICAVALYKTLID